MLKRAYLALFEISGPVSREKGEESKKTQVSHLPFSPKCT